MKGDLGQRMRAVQLHQCSYDIRGLTMAVLWATFLQLGRMQTDQAGTEYLFHWKVTEASLLALLLLKKHADVPLAVYIVA